MCVFKTYIHKLFYETTYGKTKKIINCFNNFFFLNRHVNRTIYIYRYMGIFFCVPLLIEAAPTAKELVI